MKNIILFVHVMYDGLGDYSHFVDIYLALRQQKEFKLISIIKYSSEHEKFIADALKKHGISNHHLLLHEKAPNHIKGNKQLQQDLSQSKLLIQVSHRFSELAEYAVYCPQKTVLLCIGEHEYSYIPANVEPHLKVVKFNMGLGKDTNGIKLCNFPLYTTDKCKKLNEITDTEFLAKLLNEQTPEDFFKKNIIVPAYFNKLVAFMRFIFFLGINQSISDKDITIYFSTMQPEMAEFLKDVIDENLKKWRKHVNLYLEKSNLKEIVLLDCHEPSTTESHFPINENGERTIRILSGFWLDSDDYNRLFSIATITGVSGDKTLEKAIDYGVLPYYVSTHFREKLATIDAIRQISQTVTLSCTPECVAHFDSYLNKDNFFKFGNEPRIERIISVFPVFEDIDIIAMSKVWPQICDELRKNHNFYDKLVGMVIACTESLEAKEEQHKGLDSKP